MRGTVRERGEQRAARSTAATSRSSARATRRTANDLMEASRARRQRGHQRARAGRKLQEAGTPRHYEARDVGAHAQHAGAMRAQLRNASTIAHGRLMAIDHAATAANNRHSRAGVHLLAARHHAAAARAAVALGRAELLGPDDGDAGAQRRGGLDRVALRRRRHRAEFDPRARVVARSRRRAAGCRRRSSTAAASSRRATTAAPTSCTGGSSGGWTARTCGGSRARRRRRRAACRSSCRRGTRSAGCTRWSTGTSWSGHAEHLYGVVRRRLAERDKGHLTHEEIVRKHPTGWKWLDRPHHTAPTVLGDAVRRVLYRKETGKEPPWHEGAGVHARVAPPPDRGAEPERPAPAGGRLHGGHGRRALCAVRPRAAQRHRVAGLGDQHLGDDPAGTSSPRRLAATLSSHR